MRLSSQPLRCLERILPTSGGFRSINVEFQLITRRRQFYSTETPATVHDYCLQQVRKFDYDHYLCGLFFRKASSRKAYFAVRAFNLEIANIREVVKDPAIGRMRIQWWRDNLTRIYQNAPPEHPVATALAEAVRNFRLTKGWFNKMLDRREMELLEGEQMRNIDDIEAYAEDTASAMLYLSLECLGVKNLHADHVASHIGKAEGTSILLRATPHHASKRRSYLPLDLMAKHGVSQEDLFRGQISQQLTDVVFEVASSAKLQLDKARSLDRVPTEAFPALIPAVLHDDFLKRLQKAHFNIYDPSLKRPGPWVLPKMVKASWLGKLPAS
eukprot:TRINITY_DN12376_c0_g1_i1.p1 TRINITY_DN12376_c0_g1~~TRINITY_DN12376_c0_g1_i1.p1  ORF type:complete len:327 (+),score=63.32 TRINITY_DN12376_c0_g1_i1:122-1102(+)